MSFAGNILASGDAVTHIFDVPWRIGGHAAPWMSGQIAVMILAGILLLVAMPRLVRNGIAKGQRHSMGIAEILVLFIRNRIARLTIGPNGDKAVPYLATLFVFLLVCNVLSLTPIKEISELMYLDNWGGVAADGKPMNVTPIGGTPASSLWVCAGFAGMTLLVVLCSGYVAQVCKLSGRTKPTAGHADHTAPDAGWNLWMAGAQRLSKRTWPMPIAIVGGVWTWLNSFVPPVPGVVGLAIWPVLLILELIGYGAKCFALCIRLLANLSAGHILLGVLLGFATSAQGWMQAAVGIPTAFGVLGLMILELLVALIQAYIFTLLSALFIGLGTGGAH